MTTNSPPNRTSPFGVTAFVVAQLVIVSIAAAGIAYRVSSWPANDVLPQLREEPIEIAPLYDFPTVVTDEQLQRVLTKLMPRDYGSETKINHVDHGLRFWGMGATFEEENTLSSKKMRALLLNDQKFQLRYENAKPLLIDEPTGVRLRTQQGYLTNSHFDHTMACLAEVGTPLSYPVITRNRETTFRALVEYALRDFSLNQVEYEWSALTFALYLPPHNQWTSHEGQHIDFNLLANRMMRQRPRQGVCFGNHRLFGLVVFLRVDAGEYGPILSAAMRQQVETHLKDMTVRLVNHQHADGFWNGDWPTEKPASKAATEQEGDRLSDRILATGHALEWWAIAPKELLPEREVIIRAGQWTVAAIDGLSEKETRQWYTYLSHAGRALALWRQTTPADFYMNKMLSESN
jgi:hypothetical protein